MKKVLCLLLVCFMSLGAVKAFADARTDGMGLTAGQQIDDIDSIFNAPQNAARFGNVFDYRMGSVGSGQSWTDNTVGILHKDWEEIGYLGIYTQRPFNESNGIRPNRNWANEWGILDGNNTWAGSLNPGVSAWNGGNPFSLSDPFNRITAAYNNFNFIGLTAADPQNKLDFFWAKDNSENSTIGVHINYASQDSTNDKGSYTVTSAAAPGAGAYVGKTDNRGSNVIGADLGLGLKNLGGLDSLDISAGYSLGSVDYVNTATRENAGQTGTNVAFDNKLKDDNIGEIRANILAKKSISDATTGRIYANARIDNLGLKQTFLADFNNDGDYTDGGETNNRAKSYSDTNINVGLACEHKVADGKALVVASVGLIFDNRVWKQTGTFNLAGSAVADQVITGSGNKVEETWWVVPVNLGVEAPLFSWFKVRAGAYADLFHNVNEKSTSLSILNAGGTAFQDTRVVEANWDDKNIIRMLMGCSATMENFTLDLEVSEAAIENYLGTFQPGNGIFYANGATAVFTQADLKYNF